MKRFEKFFIIAALCLASGVSLTKVDEGDAPVAASGSTLIPFLIQWGTFGLVFFFCYVHRRIVLQNVRFLKGPLPLALLVLLSTFWSIDPNFTGRRSFALFCTTIFGYYLGSRFDTEELLGLYVRALEVMVLLSIAVVVLLPSYGISHGVHSGDWKGAFYHKNRAGELMALAFITFTVAMPTRMAPFRRWGLAALSLLLLFKSTASSALVGAAAVIAVQAVWNFMMVRRKAIVGIVLAGYPLALAFILVSRSFSNAVFGLLGKDSSFTGRDLVWAGVLHGIARKPLLGYGFQAFWLEKGGNLVLIQEKTSFVPVHAHNGYLNLLLHVGIIGMILFLVFLARILWVTIREGRRTHGPHERWIFSFVCLIVILNLTESQLLESNLFWMSLVAFYTSLSINRADRSNESVEATGLSHQLISPSLRDQIVPIT